MKKDTYRLAGRSASESIVERFLPEFDAQGANRRVGDELWEANELEVEGSEGSVGVADGGWDEATDEMGVIIAGSVFVVSENWPEAAKVVGEHTAAGTSNICERRRHLNR
jgi:hypothetical protein